MYWGGEIVHSAFIKLLVILFIISILPFTGLLIDTYIHTPNLFFGSYKHVTQVISSKVIQILRIVGILGLILGLIHPKLSLWYGEAIRIKVVGVYFSLIIFSYLAVIEGRQIQKYVSNQREQKIELLYNELAAHDPRTSINQKIKRIDSNIRLAPASSSKFNRVVGFPYNSSDNRVLEISFPILHPKSKIVAISVSDPMADDLVADMFILIQNNNITSVKPEIINENPK